MANCIDFDKLISDKLNISETDIYLKIDRLLRMNLLDKEGEHPQIEINDVVGLLQKEERNSKEELLLSLLSELNAEDSKINTSEDLLDFLKKPLIKSSHQNTPSNSFDKEFIDTFQLSPDGVKTIWVNLDGFGDFKEAVIDRLSKRTLAQLAPDNPHEVEVIDEGELTKLIFTPLVKEPVLSSEFSEESQYDEVENPFEESRSISFTKSFNPNKKSFMEGFLSLSDLTLQDIESNLHSVSDDEISRYLEDKNITGGEKDVKGLRLGNSIFISRSLMQSKNLKEDVILHEAAHVAMDKKIETDPEFVDNILNLVDESYRKTRNIEASISINKIEDFYKKYKSTENAEISKQSAAKEFVAELMSNKDFQILLNNIEADQPYAEKDLPKRSLLDKFIDTVAKLFKIYVNKKGLLQKALLTVENIHNVPTIEESLDDNLQAEENAEISSFTIDSDIPRFVRNEYSYEATTKLADKVLNEYYEYAKDSGYKKARGIIESLDEEHSPKEVLPDSKGEVTKGNWLDAAYFPKITRDDNVKNFNSAVGRLQAGDLILVTLRKKNGEPLLNDKGEPMTKWFPMLYLSSDRSKIQFAKSYGKYNNDSVNVDSVVAYRELAGDSQEKLDTDTYEKIAEEYNIYRAPSARAKVYEYTDPKTGETFKTGKAPNPQTWTTLSVEENTNALAGLGRGDQIRVPTKINKETGRRGYVWMPLSRVMAGGVEVVTKNGKPFIVPFAKIQKVAYNRKRLAKDSFDLAKKANAALRQYNDVKAGLAENDLFRTTSTKSQGIKIALEESSPDLDRIEKMRKDRRYTLNTLSKGDLVLVQFDIKGKKVSKWVPLVSVGDKAVLVAWKPSKEDEDSRKVYVRSFPFNDVHYVGYNHQNTEVAMKAFLNSIDTTGKYEDKVPASEYYVKGVTEDNRNRVYSDLKPGDVVEQTWGNDGKSKYKPVVKVEKGKVYLGEYVKKDAKYTVGNKDKQFDKILKKGYKISFLNPKDMVQVGHRYNSVLGLEGSGHYRLTQRVNSNNETFGKEMKSKLPIVRDEKDAVRFNNKHPKSPYKYMKQKTGEYKDKWVKVFKKNEKPVVGLARLYRYKDLDGITDPNQINYYKNAFLSKLQAGDYLEMKFKNGDKFFKARVLSIGKNRIYFTRIKDNKRYSIRLSEVGFTKDSTVHVKSLGARLKYGRDVKWVFGEGSNVSTYTSYTPLRKRKATSLEITHKFNRVMTKEDIDVEWGKKLDLANNQYSTNPENTLYESGVPSILLGKQLGISSTDAHDLLHLYMNGTSTQDTYQMLEEITIDVFKEELQEVFTKLHLSSGFNKLRESSLKMPVYTYMKDLPTLSTGSHVETKLSNKAKCKI